MTLGAGCGGRSYPLASLPAKAGVPWGELHDIPTVVVTGSNGKTTTVRLLAACARAHGWRAAYNCTDGVFIGQEALASALAAAVVVAHAAARGRAAGLSRHGPAAYFGVGFKPKKFTLDYAFRYESNLLSSHQATVVYTFNTK